MVFLTISSIIGTVTTTAQNFLRSKVIAALVCTALINGWLAWGHPFRKVPTANLDTGEVLQTVTAYRRGLSGRPGVVFLGSSLIIAPVMQAEANYLKEPIPRMTHRRSLFLEKELAASDSANTADRVGTQEPAYCLGVGGAMISDSYLMIKNVLCADSLKPRAIVYGIAPRDVQDNLLPGIESTETFRGLADLGDLQDAIKSNKLTFENKGDLALSRLFPLWLYRSDARIYAILRAKKTMEATMPWVLFDKYGETLELKPRRHGSFPEEALGTPKIYPGAAMDHISREATQQEYRTRYLPISLPLVDREFGYLDKLIALCKERKIELLMVNMPLSHENLSILPSGFYEQYRSRLQSACLHNEVAYVDLCQPKYQNDALYVDGVHLDSPISQAFLHELCESVGRSGKNALCNKITSIK